MKMLVAVFSLLAASSHAQTYEEKVVAAVLMGEAWSEGQRGMTAVGEVIHQRAVDKNRTPLQVVVARRAFSCLNRTTPDRLVRKFVKYPDYQKALQIAQTVCQKPEALPGLTAKATHFTRVDEKPVWARGRKPVVVIGDHAFYRFARY